MDESRGGLAVGAVCPSWAEERSAVNCQKREGARAAGEQSGQQPEAGRRLACLGAEHRLRWAVVCAPERCPRPLAGSARGGAADEPGPWVSAHRDRWGWTQGMEWWWLCFEDKCRCHAV